MTTDFWYGDFEGTDQEGGFAMAEKGRVTRMHHMGIAVSDLDRSLEFYADVFGIGPGSYFAVPAEFAEEVARVRADCRGAILDLDGATVELLEYANVDKRPYELRNCDVGASHPCFEVDDIDAMYARLQARGADCYTPPLPIDEGALAGYRWLYFEDPDGMVIELFEPPAG
jgi:catechol 2,3-dioxygenase-like lactoylglutathione lyase family enzyme